MKRNVKLISKFLILAVILNFSSGCSIKLQKVKQTKPGVASGEIVVKPSK